MIKIKLPFWMDGLELAKLVLAATNWWALVESWMRWPLSQTDPLTCSPALLNLIAFQRDVKRFNQEPENLFRKRVKFAYINAEDAGSKQGFIDIFERLGIGYVEIEERVDPVDWDVILLTLSDSQLSQNLTLINQIIIAYGRTCRRYNLVIISPTTIAVPSFSNNNVYAYDVAILHQTVTPPVIPANVLTDSIGSILTDLSGDILTSLDQGSGTPNQLTDSIGSVLTDLSGDILTSL